MSVREQRDREDFEEGKIEISTHCMSWKKKNKNIFYLVLYKLNCQKLF